MLGVAAQQLLYRTIEDFNSPADWMAYMYGDSSGVVYRAVIDKSFRQTYYRTSALGKAEFERVPNCYISMNSFFRTRGMTKGTGRAVEYLKRINAFWVDIDCYKKGLRKEEVLQVLEDDYIGSVIPEPTFVIDSGRGLYLIWKLRNEDRCSLPRWTRVQKCLTEKLSVLGSDPACVDAARVLRVPFSLNPKSNSMVQILEFNDLTYSIYDISREYDVIRSPLRRNAKTLRDRQNGRATTAQIKFANDIKKKLDLPEGEMPSFDDFAETKKWIAEKSKLLSTPQKRKKAKIYSFGQFYGRKTMLVSYCKDIETLMRMRTGENCKREIALFLYRYFLRELKAGKKHALEKTLQLNSQLDCPLDKEYVKKRTASADRRYETGVPYAYSKGTIIKVLDITNEELACLQYLSLSVCEKERRRVKNRKNYENRVSRAGKELKEDAIAKRRASVFAMLQNGSTAVEIQKKLNISRATYHRDLNAVKAALPCTEQAISVKTAAQKGAQHSSEELLCDLAARPSEDVVSDLIEPIKEKVNAARLRVPYLLWFRLVSHNFSPVFIILNSFAVLRSENFYATGSFMLLWLIKKKDGDRG